MPVALTQPSPAQHDDDIVITGLSGRLPDSDNIEEFAQHLFDGVDLVSADDRRWTPGLHGLPERNGKLKDLVHFDATHFGVHAKQAHLMDPQLRLLLELTHEAMVDAGVSPGELRGSRTGCYVGVSNSETEEMWTAEPDKINGYALTGCCRAMFPNRISYTFDLRGPSYAVDTACSSSMFALAQAVSAMKAGQCDAAVVGGTNLCLKPGNSLNFHRLSMLSPEGRCAAFDASGRGYVRSEAAVVVLVQRRRDARRVYATVRGANTNTDGFKDQGITFPSGDMQRRLATETFKEAGLKPSDVAYVEAHGTGTKVGDPQEVNAIAKLFCEGRNTPLLLGSVKSNMGHSEPASGLCSIAKCVIAMERGVIPANLHFKSPNPDIPALNDGRIKVVDKNTPWDGGLIAVNSFGFGGANAHIILESERSSKTTCPPYGLPRVVVASGRTEEAVHSLLERAASHPKDQHLHAMLDAVHAHNIPAHMYRGYRVITDGDQPVEQIEELENSERREVWWVFSGMGSQWAGMAKTLLALPVFAESVRRSAVALRPHGLDLVRLLTEAPESAFDDVVNSFVSIAAAQVAFVDVLRAARLTPDGIVGHSVGEIGCAYADGTLTGEQAVLAAYMRGRSIVEAKLAPGAMAAVGLSWEECVKRCPPDVQPACHNASDSVTISGPPAAIDKFVEELTAEGTFARRVNSSGVAFHSKYIATAAPKLLASLKRIITDPKPRSKKWISTSVPKDKWDSELARYSSADYHVNNLTSPVKFAEGVKEIPAGAIVVEVAPHALLQAVLRRACPGSPIIGLVRKDQPDPCIQVLSALGRIYAAGSQVAVGELYPRVQWPVPRGTPSLASHVKWDHSIEWSVANYGKASRSGENVIEFDLGKNEDSFIEGHTIDGRILFPATGYLTLVWRTMARLHNKKVEETAIVLEDVQFSRATIMTRDAPTRFLVNVLEGSGEFEVQEGGGVAVSGKVRLANSHAEERLNLSTPSIPNKVTGLPLSHEDIYKELRLRGYHYGGIFRGINDAEAHARTGHIKWTDNWIAFMDNMLQFAILGVDSRQLYLPTRLQRAHIDPTLHTQHTESGMIEVHHHQELGVIRSGGVELRGVKTSLAPRRANTQAPPKLERYVFVPYDNTTVIGDDSAKTKKDALTVCVQTVLENVATLRLKVTEPAFGRNHDSLLTTHVVALLDGEPQVRAECAVLEPVASPAMTAALQPLGVRVLTKDITTTPLEADSTLVLATDVIARHPPEVLSNLAAGLAPNGMMILEEPHTSLENPKTKELFKKNNLELLMRQRACTCEYLLLRLIRTLPSTSVTIQVKEDEFSWVEDLKVAMKRAESEDMRVYLVSTSLESGILGLMTCVRSEPGGGAVRAVWTPGTPKAPLTPAVLNRDLVVNVLQDNAWGCYRHMLLNDPAEATLQVKHAYVNTLTRGDLSSLRWIESPLGVSDDSDDTTELCDVHYAPLNFRDIMLATGKLPPDALPGGLAGQDCILGLEFSGRSQNGKRVMGMVAAQGLATAVRVDPAFLWPVPDKWTLEQAATVPVAYATAYYALSVRGRMAKGESVLIHAGSGGVGQAAISIALHAGCTVYTTVGTPDKRAYLRKTFPNLPDEHIGNSRDTSFEQMIMTRTNGRGVDLVLNSLAADKLQASIRCLAEGGRFLEIGKLDLSNNTPLGMAIFLKNTTFHGILLDALFDPRSNSGDRVAVVKCVNEGITNGAVRPLPSTVYTSQQLEAAFRYMATGKHIGKVLIKVREEEARTHSVCASPRMYCAPDSTHVLVGGLGGFGLELAEWLVRRGAKNIVLTSRAGVKTGYQASCIRRWRNAGVKVEVSTADVTTLKGAQLLMKEANKLGPVAAIYNLAAVLRDAFMENQTAEDFKIVAAPKIDGTINLDIASRSLCPSLRHFVVFSSVSCGRGNPGQTNYGLANSHMERVCERRHRDGLPALAVQWGAIGDVGLVANMGGDDLVVGGTLPQRISSCLDTLGALMSLPHPVTASMVLADKRKAATTGGQKDLVHAVANILGLKDPSKASDSATLADLGMDSLMGAEIKQTLERGYDLVLGVQEIRTLTFGKLKAMGGGGDDVVVNGTNDVTPTPAEEKLVQFSPETLMPKEVVVPLNSSGGDRNIFMVHPIEGSVTPLSQIAKSVKAKVYGLQCAKNAPLESMSALARHYVSAVRAIQARPPYMLFGYSFGAGVAFEMALQLEKSGCACRLVLLDGSPAYLSTHTRRGKSKRTGPRSPAADEADALAYFTQQFQQDLDVIKLSSEMESLPSWEDRVRMVTRLVPGPSEDLAAAATAFYRKLVISDTYTPTTKLKAPVDLFTATDNYVTLESDYGLGSVCTGTVNTRQLTGDHRSILTGEPARIIAEYLTSIVAKTN